MIPSIYINLEDDVSKIVSRLKKERALELILVCPKRCFLFNDSINLRLLKKQTDLLKKKVSILTMDERGQAYAKEAGFDLKYLPKAGGPKGFSDIATKEKIIAAPKASLPQEDEKPKEAIKTEEKTHATKATAPHSHKQSPVKKIAHQEVLANENTERVFPKELEGLHKQQTNRKRNSRLIAFFLTLSLVSAVLVVFVFLPRAEIVIYPKTQGLTRDLSISVSTQAKMPDSEGLILPGVKINKTVNEQNNFQSQGKKEVGNKATGSVVIYNFTNAPINLRAKTTLLILNGKNYELNSDILQLKPTKYKNSKTKEIDESSLGQPISVTAAEGGEGYNIPAGTRLEITNQVFGLRPQLLYAKANTAITGGTSRYLSVISQDDIAQAKLGLQKAIHDDLSAQISGQNLVAEDKALQTQNLQFVFDHEVGTETPSFTGKVTAEVLALAYNKNDLEKIVLDRVSKSLSTQGDIDIRLNSPLTVSVKSVDFENELLVLEVHFDGLAVAKIFNPQNFAQKVFAKSQIKAADYIKNNAQVEKVEITLAPSWQTWLPLLKGNIKIILK